MIESTNSGPNNSILRKSIGAKNPLSPIGKLKSDKAILKTFDRRNTINFTNHLTQRPKQASSGSVSDRQNILGSDRSQPKEEDEQHTLRRSQTVNFLNGSLMPSDVKMDALKP